MYSAFFFPHPLFRNLTYFIQFHFTDISGSHCISELSPVAFNRVHRTPRSSEGESSPSRREHEQIFR